MEAGVQMKPSPEKPLATCQLADIESSQWPLLGPVPVPVTGAFAVIHDEPTPRNYENPPSVDGTQHKPLRLPADSTLRFLQMYRDFIVSSEKYHETGMMPYGAWDNLFAQFTVQDPHAYIVSSCANLASRVAMLKKRVRDYMKERGVDRLPVGTKVPQVLERFMPILHEIVVFENQVLAKLGIERRSRGRKRKSESQEDLANGARKAGFSHAGGSVANGSAENSWSQMNTIFEQPASTPAANISTPPGQSSVRKTPPSHNSANRLLQQFRSISPNININNTLNTSQNVSPQTRLIAVSDKPTTPFGFNAGSSATKRTSPIVTTGSLSITGQTSTSDTQNKETSVQPQTTPLPSASISEKKKSSAKKSSTPKKTRRKKRRSKSTGQPRKSKSVTKSPPVLAAVPHGSPSELNQQASSSSLLVPLIPLLPTVDSIGARSPERVNVPVAHNIPGTPSPVRAPVDIGPASPQTAQPESSSSTRGSLLPSPEARLELVDSTSAVGADDAFVLTTMLKIAQTLNDTLKSLRPPNSLSKNELTHCLDYIRSLKLEPQEFVKALDVMHSKADIFLQLTEEERLALLQGSGVTVSPSPAAMLL